jgi:glucosylceramidase
MGRAGQAHALCLLGAAAAAVLAVPAAYEPSGPPPSSGCWPTTTQYGVACTCTADYCDTVTPIGSLSSSDAVTWYASVEADVTQRLTRQPDGSATWSASEKPGTALHLSVDRSAVLQPIQGFGNAMTDAAAWTWTSMDRALGSRLLDAYWSDTGLRFGLARTHIGSCDFSLRSYSYAETPGDFNLSGFSIDVDRAFKLPYMAAAFETFRRGAGQGRNISLFATAWSPPAWMKTNGNMTGGSMIGQAGDDYHKALGMAGSTLSLSLAHSGLARYSLPLCSTCAALYYSKFISAYEAEGFPLWAITPQNEPLSIDWWDSCFFTGAQQRDFLASDLGPLMRAQHPTTRLLVVDDQRSNLPAYTETILSDARAAPFVDGAALHWYDGGIDDLFVDWTHLDTTDAMLANSSLAPSPFGPRFMLATEACQGFVPVPGLEGPHMGQWSRGLVYAYDATCCTAWPGGSIGMDFWTWAEALITRPIGWTRRFCAIPTMAQSVGRIRCTMRWATSARLWPPARRDRRTAFNSTRPATIRPSLPRSNPSRL